MRLTPKTIAAALLIAGIGVGTWSDDLPIRSVSRAGGYELLAGDFHVHAFPGDGALTPWSLREEARRAGLDVFAVTNHNRTFTARFAGWLSQAWAGPIMIPGEEITAPDYHLIAVGVERTVTPAVSVAQTIAAVHAQNGLAIAAHPDKTFHGYDSDEAVAALDGTEAAHPTRKPSEQRQFAMFFERVRRLKPNVAPIGSSDFHMASTLGSCRTFLFVRERTAAGVLEAIREGRTVASDQWGELYGDPQLVHLAKEASLAGRTHVNDARRMLSVALAWLGIAGLALLR